MPTIDSPDILAAIIAGNGVYPGDDPRDPVVRVVQYTNAWGGRTHGIVYAHDAALGRLRKYEQVSEHIRDPVVVFEQDMPAS